MNKEIKEKFDLLISQWSINTRNNKKFLSSTQVEFYIDNVILMVNRLEWLAQTIRNSVAYVSDTEAGYGAYRDIHTIQQTYLHEGQAISSFLWQINLKNSTAPLHSPVDIIELTYGVSFNGLGINRTVINRIDNSSAFVLHHLADSPYITLSNPQTLDIFGVSKEEFNKDYYFKIS